MFTAINIDHIHGFIEPQLININYFQTTIYSIYVYNEIN